MSWIIKIIVLSLYSEIMGNSETLMEVMKGTAISISLPKITIAA